MDNRDDDRLVTARAGDLVKLAHEEYNRGRFDGIESVSLVTPYLCGVASGVLACIMWTVLT